MLRTVFTFAILIIAIALLFRISAYTILSGNTETELVLAAVAIVFFFIGLFINRRSQKNNPPKPEEVDLQKIRELGISKREYEVLEHVAGGLSNKQIAEQLFVSESTVKTHVSNLLVKLDAKRRTQAIQIAKEEGILL